jgi:hypothetical protein
MSFERLLNFLVMRGRPTLLALLVIFFIPSFGCSPLLDLGLTREATSVPDSSSPDEGPLMYTELAKRVSVPSPVRRKDVGFVPRQIESSPIRQVSQVSIGGETSPIVHTGETIAGELLEPQDTHPPTVTDSHRTETLNALEKDGASIDMSEVIIFLLVGTVFLLVHISRSRPAEPLPDAPLAKLLHTRPWR